MKRFLALVAVVWVVLMIMTCHAYANGGYPAAGFAPACNTCPQSAPILPQANISYVPRTVQFAETQYVPQTIVRQQTVFEPQLSYSMPQAAVFPPVKAPCADFTIQRSFAPQYSVQRSFVPQRSFAYAGTGFAPVRTRAFAQAGVGYSYGASAFAGVNVGVGRSFRFNQGFVGGGTNVQVGRVGVQAVPGQAVDVRRGGLRGVLFGTRVRVR